jgi:four helix bundle protein
MSADLRAELCARTKAFALRIVRLYCALPKKTVAQVLGKQLLRSGTSVGAQYREAVRARSTAEFVSKIESALQELEETTYWIELLVEGGIVPARRCEDLRKESDEIMAILVSSVKKIKGKEASPHE